MPQKHPESTLQAEIADINCEFLRLLTDSHLAARGGALGLDEATLRCLRQLKPDQLDNIAAAPLLLVEFRPLSEDDPATDKYRPRTDQMVAEDDICPQWERELVGFANRLLIFVWQATRYDRMLSAFCLGLDETRVQAISELNFSRLSRLADGVAATLNARLSHHPTFWQDLIRSVRSGTHEQQLASRLAAIQLSIVGRWTPAEHERETCCS